MGTGLFITMWLARYLGPEQFGTWNYVLAYIAIITAISTLGLDSIIIRDIVKWPNEKNFILGSAFLLRIGSALIALIASVSISYFINADNTTVKLMISIMSLSLFFQAFDVIDFYFQSQIKVKYIVFARNSAFIISAILKILLIVEGASLVMFAYVFAGEFVMSGLLLLLFYRVTGNKLLGWKINKSTTFRLLRDGWPLFLAFISSVLYLKADQIMIGQMLDIQSVGMYSASLRIYEIPFSILIIITSSIFPKIIEIYERDKELFFKRYSQITTLYTMCSLVLLIIFVFWGKFFIELLFGENYDSSYSVLIVHTIALIFVFNGMLRSSYLSITANEKIIFYTSLISSFLNIILNYLLIPFYGIIGAAIATAITQAMALLVSNLFFQQTRILFFIQLKAFILINSK